MYKPSNITSAVKICVWKILLIITEITCPNFAGKVFWNNATRPLINFDILQCYGSSRMEGHMISPEAGIAGVSICGYVLKEKLCLFTLIDATAYVMPHVDSLHL
jgi:hypothetical protein